MCLSGAIRMVYGSYAEKFILSYDVFLRKRISVEKYFEKELVSFLGTRENQGI